MTSVFGFGKHADGQLGLGGLEVARLSMRILFDRSKRILFGRSNVRRSQVATVARLSTYDRCGDVVDVACGSKHSVLLLSDGSISSCGNNDSGQLGHTGPCKKLSPISDLCGIKICQIGCGDAHCLALTDDGHLYSWGSNEFGQLGINNALKLSNAPSEISMLNVVEIACGCFHSLALCSDGKLFVWGKNDKYQLGLNLTKNEFAPQELRSLYGLALRQIAAGESHSIALSVSGAVYTWGNNEFGQLGIGDLEHRAFPVHVKNLRYQTIVKVFCGDNHTAALTKEGGLFTFGADMSGQLGHGGRKNEFMPKQVIELMGSKVCAVACGRRHTLALVGKKMYACGLGASGQLGFYKRKNLFMPTLVKSDLNFRMVFTGGDHSFAICTDDGVSDNYSSRVPIRKCVKHLNSKRLEYLLKKELALIIPEFKTVFSNAACLNHSFLLQDYAHYGANKNNSGVAMDDVMTGFEMLNACPHAERLKQIITNCLESRLFDEDNFHEPPDIEALRIFIILPWCPVYSRPENYKTLHMKFAKALLSLKSVPMTVIELWWGSFETRHFNRVLTIFKQVISHILSLPPVNSNELKSAAENTVREQGMKMSLELLVRLNKVNLVCKKLPFNSFYINEIADKVNIRDEYVRYIAKPEDAPLNICKYPFIFNAAVKTLLLETDTSIQLQSAFNQTQQRNTQQSSMPLGQLVNPYFVIKVSRDNIVHDTITALSANSIDLKKPLKVVFIGEKGVDAGGVKKEFFRNLFQELLNPKYGMFREFTESGFIWFTETMFAEPKDYQLIGILCGLAIYNNTIVALPFPLALYKKLLSQPTGLEDLKELSPTEGRSLEALLDYEDDDFEKVFDLVFQIPLSYAGDTKQIDLKPDGSKISVVKANRQEYVDLYVDYKLNKSVEIQFKKFNEGFCKVVTSSILNLFQPQELMEMVVGNEYYDWDEFEKNTEYEGEYWRDHATIKMFWNLFRTLTLEERKKFLLFLTGSDRVPFLGMKQIKFVIKPAINRGNDYFPVAHTCFNLLDLPQYNDENVLRKKLLESIEQNQGFSLV